MHLKQTIFSLVSIALIFLSGAYSAHAETIEWQMPIDKELRTSEDIGHYYDETEVVKVLAGDTELTALYRDHMAQFEKGVAILIADWHLTQSNDKGIDYLRKSLNDYGWITYSISAGTPPRRNNDELPENPNQSLAPIIEKYTKPDFDAYSLSLISRFKAMYQQALTHPGFVILITQGQSGAILNNYLNQENAEQLDALILLNNFFNDPKMNRALNQTITSSMWPTLDIHYQSHNHWLNDQMAMRKKLTRRNQKTNYRQRTLFGSQSSLQQHQRLSKEVYGFLTWLGI